MLCVSLVRTCASIKDFQSMHDTGFFGLASTSRMAVAFTSHSSHINGHALIVSPEWRCV